MNINLSRNNFIRRGWLFAMLLAVSCPLPGLHAEPEEREVHGRFLFIFDTSAGMKKRVPAVELAVNTMLATSISGQLHKGDTIGVWTFSQDLHPGDFPLQMWEPDDAAVIATNLAYFIRTRKYENKTRFEALQPLLRRVVQSSERLTVLIFSDGATKITGTTFDTGINQLFATNAAAQKKAREPFVVVLRSQLGKYVGCTVSCPPQLASLPQFPPLPPPPPAPKPVVAVVPPVAPVVTTPSLLITGTKVEAASIPPASPPPVIEPVPATASPSNAPVAVTPPATVALPMVPVVPTNVAVAQIGRAHV